MSARWTEEEFAAWKARQQASAIFPYAETRGFEARGGGDAAPEPEGKFMARVIALAKQHTWGHFHAHDSRRSPAGYPDLVLVKDTVLWIELKTNVGKLTAEQERWLSLLGHAGQECYVWRPKDWEYIVERLGRKACLP